MKHHLKRLFKGSAIYGFGNAVNQLLNMLLLPLFTKFLSPEDYGITATLAVFSLFLVNTFLLGFNTSIGVVYYDEENPEHKKDTILSSLSFLFLVCSLVLCSGIFFNGNISTLLLESIDYSYFVSLTIFSACFIILSQPLLLKFQYEENQFLYILVVVSTTIISLGLKIILVVYLKKGVAGIIESNFLSRIFQLLLLIVLNIKFFKFKHFRINLKLVRELLRIGIPMLPSFITLYALQQGNVFFLKKYTSLEIVGIYSIGYSFGYSINLIIRSFTVAWSPFFLSFKHKQQEAQKVFARVFTYYIWGIGLISIIMYIVAKPVIILFTEPEFTQAFIVVGLISTAIFIFGSYNFILPTFLYQKKVIDITLARFLSACLYIGASFYLVPKFGMIGACISLMAGYLSINIFLYFWSKYKKNIKFSFSAEKIRVIPFIIFYVVFVLIYFTTTKLNFITELIIQLSFLLLILAFIIFRLEKTERDTIRKYCYQKIHCMQFSKNKK